VAGKAQSNTPGSLREGKTSGFAKVVIWFVSQSVCFLAWSQKVRKEGVMSTGEVLSVVSLVVNMVVVYLVARMYGDVAGAKAARKFQEEDAKRARRAVFQSLRNEVVRIRKLAEYYRTPDTSAVPKAPVAAFETAFVSGSPALAARKELVDAVCDYLVRADRINSFVDMYLHSLDKGVTFSDIIMACDPLPEILKRLDDCLRRELES
jgi:hypothetical protein